MKRFGKAYEIAIKICIFMYSAALLAIYFHSQWKYKHAPDLDTYLVYIFGGFLACLVIAVPVALIFSPFCKKDEGGYYFGPSSGSHADTVTGGSDGNMNQYGSGRSGSGGSPPSSGSWDL